jgi:hypothetical protein
MTLRLSIVLMVGTLGLASGAAGSGAPIRLKNQRELFVDDHVVATLDGAEFRLGAPVPAGAALVFDRPWEGRYAGEYVSIEGRELPGFGETDAAELGGDRIDLPVTWKNGKSIGDLAGRVVRLRFTLRDADLYSFEVRDRARAR